MCAGDRGAHAAPRLGFRLLEAGIEGSVRDAGDLIGHEAEEPQRAQLHCKAEPVLGAARAEHEIAVTVAEREGRAQILKLDPLRPALQPIGFALARIPPRPSSSSLVC